MYEYIVKDTLWPLLGIGNLHFHSSPNIMPLEDRNDLDILYMLGIFHLNSRSSGIFTIQDPSNSKLFLETRTMQMFEMHKEDLQHVAEKTQKLLEDLAPDCHPIHNPNLFVQRYVVGDNKALNIKYVLEYEEQPVTYVKMEYEGDDLFTNMIGMKVKIPLASFCTYLETSLPITKVCLNDLPISPFLYQLPLNYRDSIYFEKLCACVSPIVENCSHTDDFDKTYEITIIKP